MILKIQIIQAIHHGNQANQEKIVLTMIRRIEGLP
jgi:hypothetical protein